jgi:hypothetical protein
MAAFEDALEDALADLLGDTYVLQKRVYELAEGGKLAELGAVLDEHPEVDADEYRYLGYVGALTVACGNGHTECARLLIDHKANVHPKHEGDWSALNIAARNGHLSCVELLVENGADVNHPAYNGFSPLMRSAYSDCLPVAQRLLEHKADIHYRVSGGASKDEDCLYWAMTKDVSHGNAFVFLSCNTDARHVKIDEGVTTDTLETHIEQYKHVQAFIDEYHRILNLVLSEHAPVDPRFGLGQMGIYQEPLERTLEYLGLSMSKDQVVNTSIDGEEGVRRALIPGHLLNAKHWVDQYTSR